MDTMRKYIFHCDYRYSLSDDCFLVWIEICDYDKGLEKFATKEDIKDIFFKKNIPFLDTVSADFYIPHQDNIRILSTVESLHPDLAINKDKVQYLKKYIDCALVPCYEFCYFVKALKNIRNSSLSPSFKYYDKFQEFVRELIDKKYYVPGFYIEGDYYNFVYYPYLTPEIKGRMAVFYDNLPLISIYGKGFIEEKRSFVDNLLMACLNSTTDFLMTKGDAPEFSDKVLRASSIAHLVIKDSGVKICGFNYSEWKNWAGRIASEHILLLAFEKTENGLWRIFYGLKSGDKTFHAREIYDSDDNNLKTFFILELVRISQFSKYIKDSLLSPSPCYVDITEDELLEFLKYDAGMLGNNRVRILYPQFFQNIHKIRAKIKFKRKNSVHFSKGAISRAVLDFDWQLYAGDILIDKNMMDEILKTDQEFIKIGDRYIELDSLALKRIISNLRSEEAARSEGVAFFEALNYDLEEDVEIDKSELFDEIISGKDLNRNLTHVKEIKGFVGTLREYQEKGVSFLSYLDELGFGAILADDMGLGKTIQIIAMLLHKKKQDPALIVAPTTLLYNWEMELKKFAPELKSCLHYGVNREKNISGIVKNNDIIICSYGIVKRDLDLLLEHTFSYVIIDEAQYIKNASSDQAKAVKKLRGGNKFALTGTPIENRLMELWSIMDFVNPGLLLGSREFFNKYEFPIMKNEDDLKRKQLHEIISPFVLRRMKTDKDIIKDLPDKQEIKIFLPLTDEQAVLYDNEIRKVETEMERSDGRIAKTNMLATITKLKLICNHPLNYLNDNSPENLKKRSSKLDSLVEMVNTIEQEGRKSIIFTQFIETGRLIKRRLTAELNKKVLFFHGSLDLEDRRDMIDEFEKDESIPAMVLSLKAGGLGLNLTMANYVFHFDRWWNPAVENQAVDRVHRIGQKRNTFVYKFIIKGTLEERIDELIESKIKLSDGIIPKGDSIIAELTEKEFIKLIQRP
ncbi:MAG TPA: DEAD/DEAH box helicase [Clostridiales bacterium]|nr:DEAD/DEAH box helicase [Clostridiales bacterium]HQP70007.1 DEAD/DEAH box helicase [Clostridiales bacterium]